MRRLDATSSPGPGGLVWGLTLLNYFYSRVRILHPTTVAGGQVVGAFVLVYEYMSTKEIIIFARKKTKKRRRDAKKEASKFGPLGSRMETGSSTIRSQVFSLGVRQACLFFPVSKVG